MEPNLLLITPPFTQLNTPYPATAYLKGFLNTKGIQSHQTDFGIEVILRLFSNSGLQRLFNRFENLDLELSPNAYRVYNLREDYLATINPVIQFLQHKNPTLAHAICGRSYLPEASRFAQLEELDWAFGSMGTHDKARHLATLYLEDLGDLISEAIDPHFGFSRYAERLGRTATHFAPIQAELEAPETLLTEILCELLEERIAAHQPNVICFSVPFPGNLFGAFKGAQYIKARHPHIKTVMGGGYANTELRRLSDPAVFDYFDFICLDDGEAPLLFLLEHLQGKRAVPMLKRTYARTDGKVVYYNGAAEKDVAQRETGTPDYSDLPLKDYLSVIEIANPMHSLWSNGRWNKLTLAHGCYWGKCSFCDISLDYIKNYEPMTASLLCDRIEEIIAQTGEHGFHFVDEAAPPALLRELALEIIRRKLTVVWWINIRFEKTFTHDLAKLLKASGCIAVAGGLEVAGDRLLKLMEKGVTVAQVARVTEGFTQAGIMVHAYLMYGFPTQTAQETIDSLEMVRQLFLNEVLQSGFWHRFAMTAHSPVGLNPGKYGVVRTGPQFGGFADNDLFHDDPTGADHELFSEGLRKALFNYMHGLCFDFELQEWFNFKVPPTSIPPTYIERALEQPMETVIKPNTIVVWLGNSAEAHSFTAQKGKQTIAAAEVEVADKKHDWQLQTTEAIGAWLAHWLPKLKIGNHPPVLLQQLQESYEQAGLGNFTQFTQTRIWQVLKENGLLVL